MNGTELKKLRFDNDLTQENLGEILGCTKQHIYKLEKGISNLTEKHKKVLREYFGLQSNIESEDDCITIEHIRISPSCGNGTVVLYEPDVTPIKLGKSLINDIFKVSDPTQLNVFTASGDSMESAIEDGDFLLVDCSRKDFNNGGVFLLTINNDWFVKRLRLRATGELDIISDNQKYPTETLKPDTVIEIKIKGKVLKNLSRGL